MTEDQVLHADDDDLNLDDEFILEDWDEDDDEILVIADNLALEADDLVIDESEIDLIDASGLEDDDEVVWKFAYMEGEGTNTRPLKFYVYNEGNPDLPAPCTMANDGKSGEWRVSGQCL